MNVLYAIIGALIGILIGVFFKPFHTRIELWWETICWKYTIPKNYRYVDKLRQIKKGKKLEICGEQYTVVGFIKYQFGICYYVPQIRPVYDLNTRLKIRWLGFEDEDLYLWAEWDDNKYWDYINAKKPKLLNNLSMTYLMDVVKANLEPSFILNNTKVDILDVQKGDILILYGEYGSLKVRCTRIKLKITGSDYIIGLIYYHDEPLSPGIFFGTEIDYTDINFPKQ